MSSRNSRLTENDRQLAPNIYKQLQWLEEQLKQGKSTSDAIDEAAHALNTIGFKVEYIALRDSELQPVEQCSKGDILLMAACLGNVRLIDNLILK
jgi:pantoate--beta-alanine ligase